MIFFGFLFLQTRVLSRASLSFSKSEDKTLFSRIILKKLLPEHLTASSTCVEGEAEEGA